MKKRSILKYLMLGVFFIGSLTVSSQRMMEDLDHGTLAINTSSGVFVTWRVLGSEWKDVSYNLYRDGSKLNTTPITGATNFLDASGGASASYYVRAIVDGVEQTETCVATVWTNNYLDIPVRTLPAGTDYTLNDAAIGDLDGDGDYEVVIKRKSHHISDLSKTEYHLLEAYHLNPAENLNGSGEVVPMWTIDMGPNLYDATEVNFLVWDLDEDGKAELITRTSDGTVDGLGKDFGDAPGDHHDGVIDYRSSVMSGYRTQGPDFLSVFDGQTGGEIARDQYIERDPMTQYGSTGGGAAHRSTKCMFTVAYLDGKKPSVVIGRGIYERIKMEAWDFNGSSLTKRWHFDTNDAPAGFHGSGNHNLSQADVDYDGKDEIVYGAMVVDDDGTGLNTTGFGHGDALHISDFDPDRFGLEIWDAGETTWGASMRTGETGEILFRYIANRDCGRACAGDINPDVRGAEVWAATECPTYSCTGVALDEQAPWPMNAMAWWDGDLLREFVDHDFSWNTGIGIGYVKKRNSSNGLTTLLTATGTTTNNFSKGNPCISADIFGDWREEIIWRRADNLALRIYASTDLTEHRLYTLMHDAQYRAAIGWQPNSYNQPPHPSFFLGHDMDSVPPPAILTNELVWNQGASWDNSTQSFMNGAISSAFSDGEDVLFDMSGNHSIPVNIQGTLAPRSVRIQTATDYIFEGTGSLTGSMDMVKAGIGKLTINNSNSFSGPTRVFLGKLEVNGSLSASQVIVKRFAELHGSGSVGNDVILQAGSKLSCGQEGLSAQTFTIGGDLNMLGDATVLFDLSDDATGSTKNNDQVIVTGDLSLTGSNVFKINMLDGDLEAGTYDLINFSGNLVGDLTTITVLGIPTQSVELVENTGKISMVVQALRSATSIVWKGNVDNVWDHATTSNWMNESVSDFFVGEDDVLFDDNGSANTDVDLVGELLASTVEINSSLNYSFAGTGKILGTANVTKNGTGLLRVNNTNAYTGATTINEGALSVETLKNGGYESPIGAASADASNVVINGGSLLVTGSGQILTNRSMTVGANGGTIQTGASTNLILEGSITGTGTLIKAGSGKLALNNANTYQGGTILKEGTIVLGSDDANIAGLGGSITFESGTLQMKDNAYSYTNGCNWDIIVAEGNTGTINVDARSQLGGTLTGGGLLTVYTRWVRSDFRGDWSNFTGAIKVTTDSDGGDFRHYNAHGYTNAHLALLANVNFYVENNGGSSIQEIGKLTTFAGSFFSGTTGYFTWKIGGTNENSLVYGMIKERGNTGIQKVGTGSLTLREANDYKRYTIIDGGSVICKNTTGSATGTSPITINNSGSLTGTGSVAGTVMVNDGGWLTGTLSVNNTVNVANGGTIAPGDNGIGALTISKTLTLSGASEYAVDVNSDTEATDVVNVSGAVAIDGVLDVNNLGSSAFSSGDKFKIINATSISGSFASVNPAEPASGLLWDLSDIGNGYLGITGSTNIGDVGVNSLVIIPNPSHGIFMVSSDDLIFPVNYRVIDIRGSVVKNGILESANQKINMEGEAKGIYLLQLQNKNQLVVRRIVIN